MIALQKLFVMQDDLRHWDNLYEMVSFVSEGGVWTPEYLEIYSRRYGLPKTSPIIQISRFEDGSEYVHDGHHRCVATWLGGRKFLEENEYTLKEWKYDLYLEINHPNGWYTPFDPRIHLRTADFGAFKKEARERFLADPTAAEQWVRDSYHRFRRDRTVGFVPELAEAIKCRLLKGT